MTTITFRSPISKPLYRLGGATVPGGPRVRTLNDINSFEITNDAAGHAATTLPGASTVPACDIGNGWCNEPILAMAQGYATRRIEPSRLAGAPTDAFGVIIDHGAGVWSIYWHLNAFSIPINGAFVKQGQPIGLLGSTGLGGVCHCHIEIKVNGTSIDPEPYIFGQPLVIGEDMPWHADINRYKELRRIKLVNDDWDTTYRSEPTLVESTVAGKLARGGEVSLLGWVNGDTYAGSTRWEVFVADGQGLRTFHSARIGSDVPEPVVDCSKEVAAAVQAGNVRVDRIKGELASAVQRIAGL